MAERKLLTAEQVSERLGIPVWSIYELVKGGELPHLRIGRRIRFRPGSLDAWERGLETGGGFEGEGNAQE